MKLNGFMIGPEIKKLFKIKVDTPTAGHPVYTVSVSRQIKSEAVRPRMVYLPKKLRPFVV